MFGLGTWEIILILVVALVFIGPDKLPQVAKSIGKGMKQVRSAMSQVDHEVRRAANDFVNAGDEDEVPPPKAAARPPKAAAPAEDDHPVLRAPEDEGGPSAAPVTAAGGEPDAPHGAPSVSSANAAPPADAPPVRTLGSALSAERDWRTHINRPVDGRVAAARPGRRPATVVEDDGGPDDAETAETVTPASDDDDGRGGTAS